MAVRPAARRPVLERERPKTLDALLEQAALKQAEQATALEPWQQGVLALRGAAMRVKTDFIELTRLAVQAIDEKWYERAGYADEGEFFDEHIGFANRTIQRYVTVYRATRALPPGQDEEALRALAEVGVHKAAIVAPALAAAPEKWLEILDDARGLKREALQDKVSTGLGLKRQASSPAGDKFLGYILNQVPPDSRAHVQSVFHALMRAAEVGPVAAFLAMVDMAARDLADQGVEVK